MKCAIKTTCPKPHLEVITDEVFCFNCYGLYEKDKKIMKIKTNQLII